MKSSDGIRELQLSDLAEISGQPYKTACRKPLSGAEPRGVLIFFSWVSYRLARSGQPTITGSAVGAADWNSFGQSVEALGTSLVSKATSAAEIVTRAIERFGTADGYLKQAKAKSPATNAIFYTRSKWELIGRLWRFGAKPEFLPATWAFELSRWRDGRCGMGCPLTLLAV